MVYESLWLSRFRTACDKDVRSSFPQTSSSIHLYISLTPSGGNPPVPLKRKNQPPLPVGWFNSRVVARFANRILSEDTVADCSGSGSLRLSVALGSPNKFHVSIGRGGCQEFLKGLDLNTSTTTRFSSWRHFERASASREISILSVGLPRVRRGETLRLRCAPLRVTSLIKVSL